MIFPSAGVGRFNLCREVIFKSTSQFRIICILSRSRAFDDDHFHHCHFLISVTIISDTKCQDFQRNTPVEESICDQYYSHAQSPEVYRLFLKYIQTTAQDDLMNQNCLIHISHAPARSLDRAQNWDDEGNDGKEDNDENGDGDDIDDLATIRLMIQYCLIHTLPPGGNKA